VTGEDVLLGKPDPSIYRLACKRMGIASKRLLAVEDAISGIRAAVGAGLRCVGVALHETPEKLTTAGAAHVVRDFETVSLQELECILLRRDPTLGQAAAAGG
jgi:beta-phosphoglucomutase-like phosphatase (HAD superfamily)